jgi:hypothetical protein
MNKTKQIIDDWEGSKEQKDSEIERIKRCGSEDPRDFREAFDKSLPIENQLKTMKNSEIYKKNMEIIKKINKKSISSLNNK